MIEQSEQMKSEAESKAANLADKLVPYTFAGSLISFALTRNVARALSVLMVDFSCALKLAMPLAVLSAMREAGRAHITVKGGKFLEAVAAADTIVFDKTGTLTHACPRVAQVVPFGGKEEAEMLRLAACLEEHFPHSMANAVVEEAKRRGLRHEEYHSKVEYLVAHGIASTVDEERVLIGSAHFIFEDEGCVIPEGEQERFDALPPEYSHLYLAVGGQLAAVICISDPLREEAKEVLSTLRALGVTNTVMLTGDSYRTAAAIAAQVGVDDFRAGVLPADKAEYVARLRPGGAYCPDGGRRHQRLTGLIRGGCRHCHQRRRRHRPGDRGHHHRCRQSLGTGRAAPDRHGADGAHPLQLPLRYRLQRHPDCPWCGRCSTARHLCHAAQSLHPGRQPAEHEPADYSDAVHSGQQFAEWIKKDLLSAW